MSRAPSGRPTSPLAWRSRRSRYAAELERRAHEWRELEELRFQALVHRSSDVVVVVDAATRIRQLSRSVERLLGHASSELLGTELTDLLHPDDVDGALELIGACAPQPEEGDATGAWCMRHRDGSWRAVEASVANLLDDPAVAGIVLNVRDVSDRTELKEQLAHQAFHDPLTGLANRTLFVKRVEQSLSPRDGERSPIAVLFIDLDDFKNVNDSLGHAAGDALLRSVAERLRASVDRADTVARLGGDEFAILLEDLGQATNGILVADRIIETLREPFTLDDKEMFVRASLGVALSHSGEETTDDLLRNADVAMYAAKDAGKACFEVFDPGMHAVAVERLKLKNELQRSIDTDSFVLHYQPVLNLASERVQGVEALVRWRHPDLGLIPPARFIGLAEETGLIVELGRWVLREACRAAVAIFGGAAAGWGQSLFMSVNVSPRQLRDAAFVEDVKVALEESGMAPQQLVLELTESALMDNLDETVRVLEELRGLGVRLAIDDFGTGYSSLGHLRRLPIDILKIDRSLVEGVDTERAASAFARTIIDLATQLDMHTIAEGIEVGAQHTELAALGCQLGQGFHFAKPMDRDALEALLAGLGGSRLPSADLVESGEHHIHVARVVGVVEDRVEVKAGDGVVGRQQLA